MSARAAKAAAIVLASMAPLYGCSGSDDKGVGSDTQPTTPTGSSGASGSSSSGSSGASGSSGTSGASSGTSGTSGTSSGATDAGPDGSAQNCVPKGYAGNDKKIGAYCDKDVSCPFQLDPFLVCTYGHTDSPIHNFCTSPCSKDSECGTGAYCMKDTGGSGCVPTQCGGKPGGS